MTNPLEILTQAQNLIRDPNNWTKDSYARTKLGYPVHPSADSAVCFCTLGALGRVNGSVLRAKGRSYLEAALLQVAAIPDLAEFNDRSTHAEVMALWDKAREIAGARLFNCCTDHAAPDWARFDVLELGGCIDDDGHTNGGINRDEAEFFTIYGHLEEGGVEAITDVKDYDDACLILSELSVIANDLPTSIVC